MTGVDKDDNDGWRRPDATMSLLADLFDGKLLDPGYAEAAARGEPARRSPVGMVVALALAGLLVVVAAQQVRRTEPAAVRQKNRLITEIHKRTAETDGLQKRLNTLRTDTEKQRAVALARSAEGRRINADAAAEADAAAARAARGSALVVTLDDSKGGSGEGRVFDQDLQIVVNGLWAAGATAIGVNGQRLTATTAIRTAGQAILVDYRPLTPPYAVTALGDPGRLARAFGAGQAGTRLRELRAAYGIRSSIRQKGSAELPAAGAVQLRYAREETPK